jgi:ABC-type uncharacterized transport system permease subunit
MDGVINLLSRALFMSTPLALGATGEVIAERTGMMVCAVEGIFLAGAWAGFTVTYITGSLLLGFLIALVTGAAVAALYGFACIYLDQHQIVMGTAVAIFMTGFCTFFYRVIFGTPTSPLKVETLDSINIPLLCDIPIIGKILFSQNIITYLTFIIVPIVSYVIFKTSTGLTMRSCGENPDAVEVAGLDVRKIRFLALLVAGCFDGVAGAFYSLANVGMYTSEIISGRGWIAFGICFLGNWHPKGALVFGIVFGIFDAIGTYAKAIGLAGIPSELFSLLPYLLVIILTATRKEFNVPAKLGAKFVKQD